MKYNEIKKKIKIDKKDDIIKGCILSFSQEKSLTKSLKDSYSFSQFNKNIKNASNFNFSKSNSNRAQKYHIYEKMDNVNKLNKKDIINAKFILKSQKIEKPITIKNEQNQKNEILPILHDKNNFLNNSITSKRSNLYNSSSDVMKIKQLKNVKKFNKSHFSVDKIKIKKKTLKKNNSRKDTDKTKSEKYINTLIVNTKTSVNKEKKEDKNESPLSSNHNNLSSVKNRGISSHSTNLIKKKKYKIKHKGKIFTNRSSSNIVESFTDLKNNFIEKKNNIDGIFLSNRSKIYDYLITKYKYNNQYSINNNNNNEETDNNININNNQIQQTQTQIYFYIYHFFKSNNLFFFIPNSKYDQIKNMIINKNGNEYNNRYKINQTSNNNKISSTKEIRNYEIIEDFYLPQAFRPRMNRWPNMPECITDTCKNGGFALIKNFDNCNLIWKLMHPNRMKAMIRSIHNNQKYNHFVSTFQLGRKDNLYKNFKYYKRLFPDMYNYAPPTYILPGDAPEFENEFKKNRKTLWIVKPVNLSRGRGIHLLRGESEYKYLYKRSTQNCSPQYLISKYIDKPHLLNNKKYDLRIYVLVASFTPLRIYLYSNGLVRFATEDYNKNDLENVYIHLTNYSINKNNLKYKCNNNLKEQQCEIFPREETEGTEAEAGLEGDIGLEEGEENGEDNMPDDDSNKWSLIEYRNHFKKLGKGHIMDLIWNQVEAIVIKTVISVSKEYYKNIYPSKINNSFELYGFDILIDKNFRAWLMEVNVNPSLHCTSPLDLSIKTDLISDIFNVVGVIPYNHNGNRSVFNYTMINKKKEDKISLIKKNLEKKEKKDKKDVNKLTKTERDDINSKMSIKCNILRNFESEKLEKKLPEYDEEHYKKIIEIYSEEKSRSHATEFSLIFPLKNNIKLYGKILIKDNAINDYNLVLWQHILTHNN